MHVSVLDEQLLPYLIVIMLTMPFYRQATGRDAQRHKSAPVQEQRLHVYVCLGEGEQQPAAVG